MNYNQIDEKECKEKKIMKENKLTIFLSHSHKDEEKVRKIRDILETLDCEPLIFFLKCLDDDNQNLEDFIKKEIEARNIFLYCKSRNSERSEWVKKELEYIRSLDKSRIYEVDIENDFQQGIIRLLNALMKMIKQNRLFVSCSDLDKKTAKAIMTFMRKKGIAVFDYTDVRAGASWFNQIKNEIAKCAEEGNVIVILSENSNKSKYVMMELEYALNCGASVIPVIIKSDKNYVGDFGTILYKSNALKIDSKPTKEQLETLYRVLIEKND